MIRRYLSNKSIRPYKVEIYFFKTTIKGCYEHTLKINKSFTAKKFFAKICLATITILTSLTVKSLMMTMKPVQLLLSSILRIDQIVLLQNTIMVDHHQRTMITMRVNQPNTIYLVVIMKK